MTFSTAAAANGLLVYRNLLKDSLLQYLFTLADDEKVSAPAEMAAAFIEKAETLGLSGNVWKQYLLYCIARDENIFSATVQKTRGIIGASLKTAVLHDLTLLQSLLRGVIRDFDDFPFLLDFKPTAAEPFQDFTLLSEVFLSAEPADGEQILAKLTDFYFRHGCGLLAGFPAFRLDDNAALTGIHHIDAITLDQIVGYDQQKTVLAQNTEAFLQGKPANNILLVGARGTGKSSSVKALINRYYPLGLRLVEIHKYQLRHLHRVIDELRECSQKFIVFLDDLSFEDSETEYKYLKSVMDGSIESKPENVIIYATSNRRHLIKESWRDREGVQDIHAADTTHEKISLSDRFGITLTFPAPDQVQYLQIIEELAARHNLGLSPEELKAKAIRWEMSHSGRSGRVAEQFIKHVLSQK